MDGSLITLDNVSAGYGRGLVIHDVSLELHKGDFMAVIGPNGGGKTTLFRTILGLINASYGTVSVMGMPPSKGCRYIGYVPQFGAFDRKYPVYAEEVVRMGLRSGQGILPFKGKDDDERVRKAMEYTGVDVFSGRRIGDLSGGQLQRTLIARALVGNPEILLLDEPTASLDPDMRSGIMDILRKVHSDGITVMMISHDFESINGMVNRAIHVDRHVEEIDASIITSAKGVII